MSIMVGGLDFVFAKNALETLDPLCLLFYKSVVSLALVLLIRLIYESGALFRKKDIWLFVLCVTLGDILYYYAEYSSLAYLPISIIAIILTFAPLVAIVMERIIYKRKTNRKMIIGIFICIVGCALIIGFDWNVLFQGRVFGYLLAAICVLCWNAYNFMTASLHERYTTVTLTLNQLICVCVMLLPYILLNSPSISEFTPNLIAQIIYLGLFSNGINLLIMVRALHVLGPTTTTLFSNFMPVSATFFGWLFLNETISPIQGVGGIIVISAGYIVIKEKGKLSYAVKEA